MIRRIMGFVFLALALIAVLMLLTGGGDENLVPAILFGILGLILVLIKGKSKEQKIQIKEARKAAWDLHKKSLSCKHAAGLPIAEGVPCAVVFDENEINISGSGNSFRLPYSKISNMQITTDIEIQKSYVSSVGGAIGGAVLFGPLGAMVGGRAKQKKSTTVKYYFIITYDKDDNIEYLSFQTDFHLKAQKLIAEKNALLCGQRATIDL